MPVTHPLIVLCFWLCAALIPSSLMAQNTPRFALVIGNSAYLHTAPLKNPKPDAKLIAKALESAQFKVHLHTDLTQKQMKKAIRDFSRVLRRIGKDAVGLVYFAGHGTQVNGLNYLLPVDANIEYEGDVGIESIAVDQLLGQLEANSSTLNIIILDACRNNPYRSGHRSSTRGLAPIKAVKGSLIAYSTAPGTTALDGDGQNSPYATALDKHIRVGGLSIEKMFKNVRVDVDRQTKGHQTPWEESSLFGDFVFQPDQNTSLKSGQTVPGATKRARKEDARLSAETAFWNTVKDSRDPAALDSYLKAFPTGLFAPLAKLKLAAIEKTRQKNLDLIKRNQIGSPITRQSDIARKHRPRPRSKTEDCIRSDRKNGRDLYCVSSVLKAQKNNYYGVSSLLDESNQTAWFEGKSHAGIGEWIIVDFGEIRKVEELLIKNGYNKRKDLYYKNGRVRSIQLTFSDGRSQSFMLKDKPGEQSFIINDAVRARWVQIKIGSVQAGTKYKDTGLNELRVVSSRP